MTQILFMLLSVASAFAARPKFHCYTYPNAAVAAYQSPVKCGKGNEMEIICTYTAGCKPTKELGEPPEKSAADLSVMFTSNELKGSFLVCKGKGEVRDGQILSAQCPTATQCQGDGLYSGVVAAVQQTTERVISPTKGAPGATR